MPQIFRGACAYKGIFYPPETHTYHERADNGEPPREEAFIARIRYMSVH